MEVNRRAVLKTIAAAGAAAESAQPAAARPVATAPPDAVGLLYDATRCIGCKACMVACKQVNNLSAERESRRGLYDDPVVLSAYSKTLVKAYWTEGQDAYVKSQCMHCVDPACAGACMMGALQKREHGIVTWEADRCIGCRYCQVVCPFDVPKFEWARAFPKLVKCELCAPLLAKGERPACVHVCPRQATVFGKYNDLLRDAHARLDADPDRYFPKVYGESEAGGTQVLYLSKAGVSFADLGLPALASVPVPQLQQEVQHGIYKGFIAPAALYAGLSIVLWRNRRRGKSAAEEGERP
jgi:Fe-S-cluster-containing dehydrogenase component